MKAARAIDPEEYMRYTVTGILPKSRRLEIIKGAKVFPAGSALTPEQTEYFASKWEHLKEVNTAKDVWFVFVNVERAGKNLVVFTDEQGLVYNIDGTPKLLGTVAGNFSPENLDARTAEPRFYDLIINGIVYQIIQ